MADLLWGIDLGGTKIECAVLDKDYNILERERIPTMGDKGYEVVLDRIKMLVDQVAESLGEKPTKIGIGTPGSINPQTNNLRNCNSVYLNGHPFQRDIQKKLGIPVKVTNDANCFAVSEYKLGVIPEKYPEAKVVMGVIMGTGVGSGIIVHGNIIDGKNGIGGEWGHNYLDASGGDCYCGKVGCVEKVISGPSLESYYTSISGNKKKLSEIVELYRSGDEKSSLVMDRLFEFFCKGISNIINVLDPDVIIIGGGLGNIDELYSEGLTRLDKYVFSDYVSTIFTKPKYGDSSGVLGASLLWT